MDLITIFIIAIGLSMDAFAVAIASGFATRDLLFKEGLGKAFKMALFFGVFQAAMPIIGWLAGLTVKDLISKSDHWIAFGLLAFVGGKMVWESFQKEEEVEKGIKKSPMDTGNLFLLAVATSIDALAVGLSLSFLNAKIFIPAFLIGCITFAVSLAGVFIGRKFGHLFEKKAELIGGLVLIGIGVKIVLEHLRV